MGGLRSKVKGQGKSRASESYLDSCRFQSKQIPEMEMEMEMDMGEVTFNAVHTHTHS